MIWAVPKPADAEDTSHVIDLATAVRMASSRPPVVRAALQAVARADAVVSSAQGSFMPKLTTQLLAGVTEARTSIYDARDVKDRALQVTGQGDAEWTPVDFGVRRASVAAARADRDGARRTALETEYDSVRAAAELFLRVLTSQRLVENARLTVERRNAISAVIERLIEEGLRPEVDLLRAEIEAVAARHALEVAEAEVEVNRAALGSALGLDPVERIALAEYDDVSLEPGLPLTNIVASAQSRRPEPGRALALVRASASRASAARAARWPTFGVSANTRYLKNDPLNENVGVDQTLSAQVQVFLRLNLDATVLRNVAVAECDTELQREGERAVELSVRTDAVVAFHDLTRADALLEQSTRVLAAAQTTREAQHKRYAIGDLVVAHEPGRTLRLTAGERSVQAGARWRRGRAMGAVLEVERRHRASFTLTAEVVHAEDGAGSYSPGLDVAGGGSLRARTRSGADTQGPAARRSLPPDDPHALDRRAHPRPRRRPRRVLPRHRERRRREARAEGRSPGRRSAPHLPQPHQRGR